MNFSILALAVGCAPTVRTSCRDDEACAPGATCRAGRCVPAATGDMGPADIGGSDAGRPDARPSDAAALDGGRVDAGPTDAAAADAARPDVPDVLVPVEWDGGRPMDAWHEVDLAATDAGVPPTPDAAVPPTPDAAVPPTPDAGCRPGTSLGLCTVCGPDGEPALAQDEPACPTPDCTALDRHDRVLEGDVLRCRLSRHAFLGGPCAAPGVCRGEDACGVSEVFDIAEARGPCVVLDGCEGPVPPSVRALAPGTPCNRIGQCLEDQTCSVDPRCAPFVDGTLCRQNLAAEPPNCEVYMPPVVGVLQTCHEFCGRFGAVCLGGYEDLNDTCAPIAPAEVPCDLPLNDNVCRCGVGG